MTKRSDTQTIILSAAAQRDDGNVLPLPGSLRGGAAGKVVGALLSRGLIAERVTDTMAKADPALNRIWRNEPDGRGVLLMSWPRFSWTPFCRRRNRDERDEGHQREVERGNCCS
jgi:hypothetical protein